MNIITDLKNQIKGQVLDDPVSCNLYSVDASIYELSPQAIVIPRDKQDVVAAVDLAREYGIPITARGAATGITGGCLGTGIILDLAQHLNQIQEINIENEYAVCEPGVIQDQLNRSLFEHGYRLGPDTSTGNRATLGGMTANNAAGARSLKYGTMRDHVLEVEMVLSSGETLVIGPNTSIHHPIVQQIWQLRDQYREEIQKRFPLIPRRVSGYNLDALLCEGVPNLCPLIVGSEGSLGIITRIKVRISPIPQKTALCVIHFTDMIEGLGKIPTILKLRPISLEMIDRDILHAGRASPSLKGKLNWLEGDPEMILVAEFEGETDSVLDEALNALYERPIGYAQITMKDPERQEFVWQLRKAGLGLLLSKRSYSRAIAFIEDITVAPSLLAPFMKEFLTYLSEKGKKAGIYGHAGSGCLHIRPYIDLRKPEECQTMETILTDVAHMLIRHGGSLSGEHGDGLVRSWLNPELYGDKIYKAFKRVKEIFDPENLMNPGKIVDGPPFLENLRLDPLTPIIEPETFLDFSKEGGFALAADLCNGNALCRKKEGTMCPSFQATGNEYDSTRARAQTLRGIIHGKHAAREFSGQELHDILDLCLQCKGCKTECPSQVDMAKLKTEVLFRYHKEHGISLRDRLFGNIGSLNWAAAPFSKWFNHLGKTPFTKNLLSRIGITPERELPQLALQRFSQWFSNNPKGEGKKVVLFNDTFNEYHCPDVGIAAVRILEAMGYQIILPPWQCCGRTLISKGILNKAKQKAEALVQTLLPFAEQNIPIIGLEPSCLLTIKDDFQGLLGYEHAGLQSVIAKCFTFDEFLSTHRTLPFKKQQTPIQLHGHCHQKALVGTQSALKILKQIGPVTEIPSGCCGMAGSFGYEKEHYDISMKIGELTLFPAVRESEALVAADGFSCRCQIEHATGKKAQHIASLLVNYLDR
jgi:FAD/FMN-containing dehydrogenase/Fe-S oxidoreductase